MNENKRQDERKKRQKKRKRKKALKNFFIFLAILVLASAAFVITIKLCRPDYDLKALVPEQKVEQVSTFVDEKILKRTTTTTETTTTTKPTTTKPPKYDYDEFSEFAFNTALQGNQIGNLLNGSQGTFTFSSSYIYYSIEDAGFYRFEPSSESYAAMNVDSYSFKYLNVLGDYIYFINDKDNTLYKSQIIGGDLVTVCKNVKFAYLYNDTIYTVGTDESVNTVKTDDFTVTKLYTPTAGKTVTLAGISLSRVFIVEHDTAINKDEYVTVSTSNAKDIRYFRDKTDSDEIMCLEIEGGYMYYYQKQDDDSYNLVRQKFGSEQVVTLVENCNMLDYPVVYANRLYYLEKDGNIIHAMEYNMNSGEKSVMVNAAAGGEDDRIGIGYGYLYVFLTGTYSGENFYRGSCIYTSSSSENTLVFKNGAWHY